MAGASGLECDVPFSVRRFLALLAKLCSFVVLSLPRLLCLGRTGVGWGGGQGARPSTLNPQP